MQQPPSHRCRPVGSPETHWRNHRLPSRFYTFRHPGLIVGWKKFNEACRGAGKPPLKKCPVLDEVPEWLFYPVVRREGAIDSERSVWGIHILKKYSLWKMGSRNRSYLEFPNHLLVLELLPHFCMTRRFWSSLVVKYGDGKLSYLYWTFLYKGKLSFYSWWCQIARGFWGSSNLVAATRYTAIQSAWRNYSFAHWWMPTWSQFWRWWMPVIIYV